MQFSARNKLKGKIVEVKMGATTAHVKINIGRQPAYAIIKASDVMVGVD